MISYRKLLGDMLRYIQSINVNDTETKFFFGSVIELEEYQLNKLNILLKHFNSIGIDEDYKQFRSLSSITDLKLLPLSTKDSLSKKFIKYTKYFEGDSIVDSTSGSSGINFKFQFCKNRKLKSALAHQRVFEYLGLDYFATKKLTLWGGVGKKSLTQKITEFVTNNIVLQVNTADRAEVVKISQMLFNEKFKYVSAYPSILASILDSGNIKFNQSLKVTLSGETIQEHHLKTISDNLSPSIFNRYGSREFGLIGHEIDSSEIEGYLVPSDRFIIEQTNDNRILITDLDNHHFPFIRYDIGDLGSVKVLDSSLGTYVSITNLNGRTSDFVYTLDGSPINPQFWTLVSRKFPGILEFQVQIRKDTVSFNSIVSDDVEPGLLKSSIEGFVRGIYPDNLNFTVEFVKYLDLTSAGKRKIVIDLTKDSL